MRYYREFEVVFLACLKSRSLGSGNDTVAHPQFRSIRASLFSLAVLNTSHNLVDTVYLSVFRDVGAQHVEALSHIQSNILNKRSSSNIHFLAISEESFLRNSQIIFETVLNNDEVELTFSISSARIFNIVAHEFHLSAFNNSIVGCRSNHTAEHRSLLVETEHRYRERFQCHFASKRTIGVADSRKSGMVAVNLEVGC